MELITTLYVCFVLIPRRETSHVQCSVTSWLEHFAFHLGEFFNCVSHTQGVHYTFLLGFCFITEKIWLGHEGWGMNTRALTQGPLRKQTRLVRSCRLSAHLTIVCLEDHNALRAGIYGTGEMLAIFSQPDPCSL